MFDSTSTLSSLAFFLISFLAFLISLSLPLISFLAFFKSFVSFFISFAKSLIEGDLGYSQRDATYKHEWQKLHDEAFLAKSEPLHSQRKNDWLIGPELTLPLKFNKFCYVQIFYEYQKIPWTDTSVVMIKLKKEWETRILTLRQK